MSEAPPPANVCYVHPNREANLRCNRCERPICPSCAVLTPTGYRCKECIRGQQKIFDTSQSMDFPIAFVTAAFLSLIGSVIASLVAGLLGLWGLLLIGMAGPAVGAGISEAVRRAIRRHRSTSLFLTAAGGAAAGALPVILFNLVTGNLWGLLFAGAYIVLITPTVYYRLRGIQMR
jgi:hypothetical protein